MKNIPFAYPHYSDPSFSLGEEVLLYTDGQKGQYCEYSDRLRSRDLDSAKKADKAASNSAGRQRTAAYWEEWLSVYFGKTVIIHKILGSTNIQGHPIWCFSFDISETKSSLFHFHEALPCT